MLRDILKEQTHAAHQKAEGIIIRKIKATSSEADYIDVLKGFYVYFSKVEDRMSEFITEEILPDIKERRDYSYIQADIEELGGSIAELPSAVVPEIHSVIDALSAMYVLEESIMGGPYIVKMLERRSEEHTSELQSRGHLVCRLLLEKKKEADRIESQTEST